MIQFPLAIASFYTLPNRESPIKVSSCTKTLSSSYSRLKGTDLNTVLQHPPSAGSINPPLTSIVASIPANHFENAPISVVTWRGVLTKLATNQSLHLIAARYKNVVYIRQAEPPSDFFHPAEEWGRVFETIVVDNSLEKDHEFCTVFTTKLNGIKLFYGAEMDCVDENGKYLEIKTSKYLQKEEERRQFQRYKMPRFWAQSYLVGIERVLVGFRSKDGVVIDIKWLDVKEMGNIVQGKVKLH